jgi:hypothetical protein
MPDLGHYLRSTPGAPATANLLLSLAAVEVNDEKMILPDD